MATTIHVKDIRVLSKEEANRYILGQKAIPVTFVPLARVGEEGLLCRSLENFVLWSPPDVCVDVETSWVRDNFLPLLHKEYGSFEGKYLFYDLLSWYHVAVNFLRFLCKKGKAYDA